MLTCVQVRCAHQCPLLRCAHLYAGEVAPLCVDAVQDDVGPCTQLGVGPRAVAGRAAVLVGRQYRGPERGGGPGGGPAGGQGGGPLQGVVRAAG